MSIQKQFETISLSEFTNYNETLFYCSCPNCGSTIYHTLPQIDDVASCDKCDKEFEIIR